MNGGLSSTTADAPNVGGMRGPIVAAISDYPYTAVMASIRILIAVLAAVLVPAAAFGGSQPVRTPRDSALVVNGVVRPMTGGTGAAAPQPRAPAVSGASTCPSRAFPDPGYRPMWVPGEWCATGLESVWIPGHWVW